MTTVMFLGMTFCLPLAYWQEYKNKKKRKEGAELEQPLLELEEAAPTSGGLKEVLLLTIPTFFDLIATILMNIGLLSVTASVYQMMRGAEMLFAALFAVVFLKRTLNKYHFVGIGCCITGIGMVGAASILSGEGSASHAVPTYQIAMGMGLIVASQAVQAAQVTFEDFFMADMAVPPLKIVGYEGLFGALAMIGIMLPMVQYLPGLDGQGIHEDTLDTLAMLRSSPVLVSFLAADMAALLAYNVSGMLVTGHLGAVFRTVLETTRTLAVWVVDLILYYAMSGEEGGLHLGERWTQWSWIQLGGFAVLVAGTVVYSKGDETEAKHEFEEVLLAEQEAQSGELGSGPTTIDARAAEGVPVSIRGGAQQRSSHAVSIGIPGSLKSTRTMHAYSLGTHGSSLRRRMSLGGE